MLRSAALAVGLARTPVALAGHAFAMGEPSLEEVASRMRYWREVAPGELATPAAQDARKYMLLEQDGAGVNNKRIGWEMAGVLALYTGRTLVLPPNEGWWMIDSGRTTSRTEDFINLYQLRGGLPVLTFKEFAQKEQQELGLPPWTLKDELDPKQKHTWAKFALQRYKRPGGDRQAEWCNVTSYLSSEPVLYVNHYPEGRLLNCEQWWNLGQPEFTEASRPWAVPSSAYSLLRNHFVWHKDVFELAAPIVRDLGLFKYVALHARFNDFNESYPDSVQSADGILSKWAGARKSRTGGGSLFRGSRRKSKMDRDGNVESDAQRSTARAQAILERIKRWIEPGTLLYISTDETDVNFLKTFKDYGIDARSSADFFDSAESSIAQLVARNPVRANKLRGCVEQVVCAFGRIFVGTSQSTFSGYITRMRIYADAPQRGRTLATRLYHTQAPSPEMERAVEQEVTDWEARGAYSAIDKSSPGFF